MTSPERELESRLIAKLQDLKYQYRADIRDRAALEKNFRKKFEALNHVRLTDAEFQRLLEEIVTPDVFTAAHTLRNRNSFTRDDGTPLNFALVNIDEWCKNTFEVFSQFRINTDNSHHRYDVILLINGIPAVQIELKTLGINPRRAIEQIVEYKNDPGNGYTRTILCFVQLFIVTNRDSTYYFANNNARHFAFNADERFLPIYEHALADNSKVKQIDAFAEAFLEKCTLGETISRYMVLVASEQKLLMMRPYQIYAVPGTVILSRDAGIGKSAVMKEAMAVSQHFMVWTCNKKLLSNWFLYYVFQQMKPRFESVASGSTIKTIGLQFFINLQIMAPALIEQQRIADCLSSLDTQIAAEAEKLAALKTHKKGLMQQLFPSPEGD